MKRYQNMKDSGVEWADKIPEHWDSVSLRYVFSTQKGKIPNNTFKNRKEGMVPYQSMVSLRTGNIEKYCHSSEGIFINDGDILILWDGSNAGELIIATEGILSSTMSLLDLQSDEMIKDFGYYLLKTWEKEIRNNTVGMGIPHVNGSYLRSIKLLLPPKSEQSQIVASLDRKTAKIDSLITNKERKIELLKEKRKALVNQAVTKGLDPDAPMKNSGVEWIREIPEGWEVKKLKYLLKSQPKNGAFKKRDQYGTGTRLVNVGDLFEYDNLIKQDELERVETEKEDFEKYQVRAYDIFFVRSSLKKEGISRIAMIGELEEDTIFECHVVKITPDINLVNPNFLKFHLGSHYSNHRYISLSETVTMTTISQEKLVNKYLFIPPLSEQNQIVEYLESETFEIDKLITKENQKIELLKEYRQSLISEVVTGKIDVRDEENILSADVQDEVTV